VGIMTERLNGKYSDPVETMHMWQDYTAGLSLAQVAAKYHYDVSSVHKRFKRRGLKMRAVGMRKREAA